MSEEAQAPQPQFGMKRIYLKDASLECPGAPAIFNQQWAPAVNLEVNTKNAQLDENHYEVTLVLTVNVKVGEETAFLIEVHQAAFFMISGFEPAQMHHTLGAYCPNLLFPYAREAVDNLAVKASFPALMLQQVNFDALYQQKLQQLMEQHKAEQGEGENAEAAAE